MTVRVLIVDDSTFFRGQILRLLEKNPNVVIVGMASNGTEAINKTIELKPDVITMDIEMPVMNGIDATRKIMQRLPTPILIFSSLSTDGAQSTLDALDAGAVDYMPKNLNEISKHPEEVSNVLCQKIVDVAKQSRMLLKKDFVVSDKLSLRNRVEDTRKNIATTTRKKGQIKVVAIGTSTGGPVALQSILKELPADFSLPILLIQHMPGTFTPAFAKRLNDLCNIQVKEAETGDVLKAGVAYLAPGGRQMSVKGRSQSCVIEIKDSAPELNYRPSVDYTFSAIEKIFPSNVLAVILTGMGADGCVGATKLKHSGSIILAQNEKSCVVYGMPAAVVKAEVVDKILDLQGISEEIVLYG